MPSERPPTAGTELAPTLPGSPVPYDPVSPRAGSHIAPPDPGRRSSIGTPEAALEQDELDRTRIFLRLTIGLVFALLVLIPLLGGDPLAKWLFVASAAAVGVSGTWMLWVLRRPEERYAEWKKVVVGACCGGCGCVGVYYWGIFSPASITLVFGVFFVSPQGSFRSGLLIYAQCALFQLFLATGVYSGLLVDRGVLRPAPFGVLDFIVLEATLQGILLASFLFARATRSTALRAIGELERTVRAASRRQAVLIEDLARALRIGEAGRYTDQTLGSFRLGVLLGHGGMGEVYEARHTRTDALAAVKLLHPHLLVDSDQIARFVREARIVASLDNPHVVKVLEVSDASSPVPFLAMERLVGRDLAEVLRETPTLDAAALRDLVDQVALGVAGAHGAGIVHRDLKPQNLFRVESAGHPALWKVLDFGLSKLEGSQSTTLTRGQIVGTPAYMAPEQACAAPVDARTDVYALAAIVYRAVTGHPPFVGNDGMALLLDLVSRMPVRPGLLAPEVTRETERVLAVGLAKEPGDRFASVEELAAALRASLDSKLDPQTEARAGRVLAKWPWSAASSG